MNVMPPGTKQYFMCSGRRANYYCLLVCRWDDTSRSLILPVKGGDILRGLFCFLSQLGSSLLGEHDEEVSLQEGQVI